MAKKTLKDNLAEQLRENKIILSSGLLLLILITSGLYFSISSNQRKLQTKEDNIEDDSITTSKIYQQNGDSLPDSFPEDLPIYPEATLTGSWTTQGESLDGILAVWETEDDYKQVADYYAENLETSGWEIVSRFDKENSQTITFKKGTINGFIGVTSSEGKAIISVTTGLKNK